MLIIRERLSYTDEKQIAFNRVQDLTEYINNVPAPAEEIEAYKAEIKRLSKRYGFIKQLKAGKGKECDTAETA